MTGSFDAILLRARCWRCLKRALRRTTHTAPVPEGHVAIRIACFGCWATRDFAVPTAMGTNGVEIVKRQWYAIAAERNRLCLLLCALVMKAAA